jgi:hypothetical protein
MLAATSVGAGAVAVVGIRFFPSKILTKKRFVNILAEPIMSNLLN